VRCYDDALGFMAELRDAQQRQRLLREAYPKGAQSTALAKLLKTTMYPYQIEGALFAARAGRALIGDEMGLGKTIQAIAAAELFARHFGVQRVLVVCPTSLKHQWQREIARFAGRDAQVIHGLRAARQQQYAADAFCKITHYETLARDADLIAAWAPELVIVDEAQRVKNWNTIAARALKRIDSPYAIVLTGTPLENRLEELISIVQFVDRHRLGPTWRLLHEHQMRDETGRVVGYRALDRIGATLAPIMLRRRKAEVLDQLPARVDNTLFVPMTEQQRKHHDENGDSVARIVKRWRKTGFLSDADQRRLTCALQNMRMSCNSTFLLDHETDFGAKADELATLLDELFEQPDAKVVIFSQWVRTHELIIRRLQTRAWDHVLFHGGVPGEQRGALVDRFREDPNCRVFLSTDAGGVGLNLQHAAATIVNMDLPWNPAVLEQRIGRVHRMGQTRSVQVVNFVAQGSIEEGMLSVLAFKRSLFAGVLDGGDNEVFLHGTRLSRFMKSVEEATQAMGPAEAGDVVQEPPLSEPLPVAAAGTTPATDPWAPLIDAGLALIQTLAAARGEGAGTASTVARPAWIETDAATGKSWLKLPMPEPAVVQRLADGLSGLLAGLRP
jgi:SNF2 family DNA or RNA helicase